MIELTADEARVLGVLVEKAQTTPDSYPLTLNAVVNGANQKNNRDPILAMEDQAALSALIGLRGKGLVTQHDAPGQRASKFRHAMKEKLGIGTSEMVILTELLLRGPQTLGELRGRAGRMAPLESLDTVKAVLEQLMAKPEPMARMIHAAPGGRAERYMQLLCPDLHPLDQPAVDDGPAPADGRVSAAPATSERLAALEAQVLALREALARLAAEIGAANPLEAPPDRAPQ